MSALITPAQAGYRGKAFSAFFVASGPAPCRSPAVFD
jgi:hypothetical protein